MSEWRKTSDQNLRAKQEQLDTSQQELSTVKRDNAKLKSENLMLRRVSNDQRSGETTTQFIKEIDSLKSQISQLEALVTQSQDDREAERKDLQGKIDQLEKVIQQGDCMAATDAHKLGKKVVYLQHELKSKSSEVTMVKD